MSSSPVHYSHRRTIATDQYRPSSSVPAVRSYRSSSKAPETSDGVVLELNPNTLIGYLGLPEASAALPPSLGITSMETSLVTIRESILNLKFAIENKRNSIAEKKKMLEKIDHKFMRSRKNTNHLQLIKRQREMTLELMKDVYRLSQRLCKCSECVCNISNLQRQQQQSDLFSDNDDYRRRRIPEQIVDASRSSKDGKILVTPAVEDSSKPTIHYSINDHCLNDCCKSGLKRLLLRYFNTGASKSYLKEPSVNSTNSIAFHSAMTALTYTIQLINVLQFIFDALLPARLILIGHIVLQFNGKDIA
ncbi:unnamed protein product [Anisakis simplex]|uniref:Uncharacterized protein n=1 Tax=Anisakis simplex TaxID=6269 RepID=A0A158PPA7_ANISI|nr:unnamed protein product [Anisakis simplex]